MDECNCTYGVGPTTVNIVIFQFSYFKYKSMMSELSMVLDIGQTFTRCQRAATCCSVVSFVHVPATICLFFYGM